ncbi:leucine--tRNA ligase [Nocardia brasiliensis]|uniref:leucine--tRNA ligase n=1 Tax=Nocardia brasiliensis TaxID=37326 RepID=UPI001894DCAE|nr:leucine--tRNA ligase [Nocardia brasiliensis]MBF6541526.1 class I tRNA ligase family protein [Nocardia brasiliensis]
MNDHSAPDVSDPAAIIDKWTRIWRQRHVFDADGRTGGDDRPRSYVVSMYSYPSGDLHMGHAEVYAISDAIARYRRLRGDDVLHPVGWDSFGLPAENAAVKRDRDPRRWTYDNIDVQAESFTRLGISFDWRTRLHTSDADYYRWNQWLFLRLFERGLAYRKAAPVNWCPNDRTVLANEQVVRGRCERCGTAVTVRELTQWFFRITAYAERLLDDMAELHGKWPAEVLTMQRNWIGRSADAPVDDQTAPGTTERGSDAVTYRLRDWLISRQRYWGTPIPVIHCADCGVVPVPEDELPVRLPDNGYQLRPADGSPPLATAREWVTVRCPACGGPAERDTDTMDTFVDSSWYFLRYPNPRYTAGPFDPEGIRRWLPVDEYIGGREHATGHLIYARFITKVLYDMGLVPFVEPFTRLTNQGQVLMAGKAMSKSLGNLVGLQDQIAAHGPDAVRVTMLFAGPPEDDIDWADVAPAAAAKWLTRVRRLSGDIAELRETSSASSDPELRRRVHRLIDATTTAMDGRRFNVAIARMMTLTATLRRAIDGGPGAADPVVREGAEALARMLSCVAPYTAEEAWERLGRAASVTEHGWPQCDPALIVADKVTCVVQVAGKVRDRLEVPVDITAGALRALAFASAKATAALRGADIADVIVRAPNVVNIVPTELCS